MEWLANITPGTVVLVPTRGLQHSLSKLYAEQQIAAGIQAWKTPNILVWEDYIETLWRANIQHFDQAYIRLDNAQAFIVWQQVITAAKKDDSELILLNEQQTASVVQRSWKLAHKWRIDFELLNQHDDIDSKAFLEWCQAYESKLRQKNWIDSAKLESLLMHSTHSLKTFPDQLIFAYFDLMTSHQKEHIVACEKRGVRVMQYSVANSSLSHEASQAVIYKRYQQEEQEWRAVFEKARHHIEQDANLRIGIVIPSLSEQRARVEQIASAVFYPNFSPLECQQNDLVYRFSLGMPLNKIAYIHSMLIALELLKKTFSYPHLHCLLMSEWWPFRQQSNAQNRHVEDLIRLDRAIKNSRSPWLSWEDVLSICQQELPASESIHACFERLIEFRKSLFSGDSHYHSARQWQAIFSDWLNLLSWQDNDLDSWHYQAHESWLETLETFVGYDLVQGSMGLSRALQALNTLCKDKVFMRQAKDEPILISGVLEGIGQQVDYLFITGMHEAYPPPMPMDSFIPNSALKQQLYPFADKSTEFQYEKNKFTSLMAGGKNVEISYASQQIEGEFSVTALLREKSFVDVDLEDFDDAVVAVPLQEYSDISGLECLQSANIKGGSQVFENQSQCPFKAYVEHRLLRQTEEDPEFGLDARDAGTVVHAILDNIWREIESFSGLNQLEHVELQALINRHVENYIQKPNPRFQFARKHLLSLEKPRLQQLLLEWFILEQEQRFLPFTVIGRETPVQTEFGGIPIRLVIDRIDRTDSGECLIIDYKTGQADVSAWNGERPKNPQMPLYALALEKQGNHTIKGIAFGKLKTDDCSLIGVSALENVGMGFKASLTVRDKKTWEEQLQEWHDNLSKLAAEFLQGQALVNPSKAKPCQYCDLHGLCRINQFTAQSGQTGENS